MYVASTIALTTYGQIVVKWQVLRQGHLPAGVHGKATFIASLLLNPWVLSALAGGFVAALAWMAALSKLEIGRAYPFMALSFVAVLALSAIFFGENVTSAKVAGIALVVAGLVVGNAL
ncbi:MAG TPA: EamA family transporter [Solirubrobacteraceae bacterium]|nr:EamA family transporter [Solirubrobacteraceae bacterium]